MNPKLFEAALERTAKTWKTYVAAICVLYLTLVIDALSGFSFLSGKAPIDLAGFKVVREALSATYGILFSLFVAAAFIESRLLELRASADLAMSNVPAVLDLWFVSPFSEAPVLRAAFWFLFIDGFLFLAGFSVIHLALINPPDPARMSPEIYRAVGVLDFVLFVICVPFACRTYRNLQQVRARLRSVEFDAGAAAR